jgi:hypothetical protein
MKKKVKVEQCPPGVCMGAIDSVVERFASSFYSQYGKIGVGATCKGTHSKKGKLNLNFKRRGG